MLRPVGVPAADAPTAVLTANADFLYRDLRLVPLLQRLMDASCELTKAVGGSISMVDAGRDTYTKTAERGTPCRLGQSFPLDEGVTGWVMKARRPVVLSRYSDLASGHLPVGHPAGEGSVAAIPIWWLGNVVGVNVIFAGTSSQFSNDEVDRLEALTQLAAPGFVAAARKDRSKTFVSAGQVRPDATASRDGDDVEGSAERRTVADITSDLVDVATRAAVRAGSLSSALHVTVVPGDAGPRLFVQADAHLETQRVKSVIPRRPDPQRWRELVDEPFGGVLATKVRATDAAADLGEPWSAPSPVEGRAVRPSPFSPREKQVATLLACGLGDRAIAHTLVISPKTVEKHVGSVLRKTGTTSRTAAVVRCLASGWVDEELVNERNGAPL